MIEARHFVVRGTVQGVGFRPFVARLASTHSLTGWVLNANRGVEIHVEGPRAALDAFATAIQVDAPAAANVVSVDAVATAPCSFSRPELSDAMSIENRYFTSDLSIRS